MTTKQHTAADYNQTFTTLLGLALEQSHEGKLASHDKCFVTLATMFKITRECVFTYAERESMMSFLDSVFSACTERAYVDGITREECSNMFWTAACKLAA